MAGGSGGEGNDGVLAIWHNCVPGREATFEHWYQSEHLVERVSIPGFRFGRRYRGGGGYRQYFIYYETAEPAVLTSDAYLGRVNDPTPLTQEVMGGIFVDPVRTVCRRVAREGSICGAVAVTGVLDKPEDVRRLGACLGGIPRSDGLASIELWEAVAGASDTGSREQQIRGGDTLVAGCLFVSVLREADAEPVIAWMRGQGIGDTNIGTYTLVCALRQEDLGPTG
jgi:hypothetical protein